MRLGSGRATHKAMWAGTLGTRPMARFSSERRAAFTRVSRHCLAIAVVAAALVGGSFSRPVSVVQSASETDQPDGRQPALARLDVNGAGAEAGTTETVDARRTQG